MIISSFLLRFRTVFSSDTQILGKFALKTSYYRYFVGFIAIASLALYIPVVHLNPFAQDKGLSGNQAALLLSMIGAAQIIGRLTHGYVADKVGAVRFVIFADVFSLQKLYFEKFIKM